MINRLLTLATHKLYDIPVLVLMPHSRCNCRCIMCDIWKANQEKRELSTELITAHVEEFVRFGVREIVLSGGEALMHSNLWNLCRQFRKYKIRIVVLSTGLLLKRNAEQIVENIDEVILSLDGSKPVHDKIRNIPGGYAQLADGVRTLQGLTPEFRITARCVIQRQNFFDFLNIVNAAHELDLDGISFLAADTYTSAFNRNDAWDDEKKSAIVLLPEEIELFESILLESFRSLRKDYSTRFILESPARMMKILNYYKAVQGFGDFPRNRCNAPWVSTVIESNGDVLPCFFHQPYGNIYNGNLDSIVNSHTAIAFRRNLNISTNPVCQRCVCTLKLGWV